MGALQAARAVSVRDGGRRWSPHVAWLLGFVAALAPTVGRAQPDPCQTFTVVSGEPDDVAAIKEVIRRVVHAYRGNEKSVARLLREFDATRFVSGLTTLERSVQRDFETLRDRDLLCRRGTLWVQVDLAVLQSEWEKSGFTGGARVVRTGPVTFQFMRDAEAPTGATWKITGLLPVGGPGQPAPAIFGAP
jgi:hypothetical protein